MAERRSGAVDVADDSLGGVGFRPSFSWTAWRRRALTIPGFFVAAVVVIGSLPILIVVALLFDLTLTRNFIAIRSLAMLVWYLFCEAIGLTAAVALWIARVVSRVGDRRWLDWHFRLQHLWATALFRAMRRLFGLRFVLDGERVSADRPLLVFMRHASVADTLLPAMYLGWGQGLRLRYVMKSELLWDPCLDVVGHRLPNAFIVRGGADSKGELAKIRSLAAGLGRGDGVLIYPEGTRFRLATKARAIQRLERAGQVERAERARRMRHVLPPRLGGPLTLLEACPGVDVLLVAHLGFEGIVSARDLWSGSIVGRLVRMRCRLVPAAEVPATESARIDWLDACWAETDQWIHDRLGEERRAA